MADSRESVGDFYHQYPLELGAAEFAAGASQNNGGHSDRSDVAEAGTAPPEPLSRQRSTRSAKRALGGR